MKVILFLLLTVAIVLMDLSSGGGVGSPPRAAAPAPTARTSVASLPLEIAGDNYLLEKTPLTPAPNKTLHRNRACGLLIKAAWCHCGSSFRARPGELRRWMFSL
jgi:hypothetical protein